MQTSAPEHLHLLPSLLSPQTSYPLVGMNRSNARHRLPDWAFSIALRRKLRLPVYDISNPPICKYGKQHDCWGDHTFHCKQISKKFTHNIIQDCMATALQPALVTAGYLRPSSKLETKKTHIRTSDITAQPLDVSFDPDPMTDDHAHTPCPYTTIGADITIAHSLHNAPSIDFSENAISSLLAVADKHLQKFERRKYMRCTNKRDNNSNFIAGDVVIGELLRANIIFLPFAIDPHGRWGPILQNFLLLSNTNLDYSFPRHRPNARIMCSRSTTHPCPTRNFFGNSYSSPTPSIYTIQQLGLGITIAFSTHIRNATRTYTTPTAPRHNSSQEDPDTVSFMHEEPLV